MVPNTATPALEELAWDMAKPLAPTVSTIPETAIIAPTTMPMIDRTFSAVCELVFIDPPCCCQHIVMHKDTGVRAKTDG